MLFSSALIRVDAQIEGLAVESAKASLEESRTSHSETACFMKVVFVLRFREAKSTTGRSFIPLEDRT
jgi:hypothetical protein